MDRYDSKPIPLPDKEEDYQRADLIFSGVDHSGPTFQAHVYLDNTDADEKTPRDPDNGYAGSFTIFGHGGCFGDEGHCEVPKRPRDLFDYRPPHQLTPATKTVIVTEALKRQGGDSVRVTVVPVVGTGDAAKREDVLQFETLRLVTYE